MDKNQITSIVIDEIKSMTAEEKVTADMRFVENLGFDSLDVVEFIMAMERKFEINISDEDAETLITVNDCLEYLYKRLS